MSVYFSDDYGTTVNYRLPNSDSTAGSNCILKQKDTGDAVRVLQYLLACNDLYELPDGRLVLSDGDYGAITKEGVRLLQIKLGVPADGIWGPQTLGAGPLYPVFNGNGWNFYNCY